MPSDFHAGGAANGPVRSFRVRVYADQDHRKQVRRWKSKFEALLSRVNKVTEATFSARLEVAEFREWQRQSGPDSLNTIQEELTKLDSGDDVDWVVGLASALPQATQRHSELGVASLARKHFVIRGMNDLAEERELDKYFTALSEEERLDLYRKRKAHKKLAVFLHEWGHTLGALHVEGAAWIMNAGYRSEARAFSPTTQWIMKIALAGRGPGENPAKRLAASRRDQYLAYQKYGTRTGWSAGELEMAMGVLENLGAGEQRQTSAPNEVAAETPGAKETPSASPSPKAKLAFGRARDAEAKGRWKLAAKHYDEITRIAPSLDGAWRGLIRMYTKLGDSDALEAAYDRYKAR